MAKLIDLSNLHNLPEEERIAIAFYASFATLPLQCRSEERMKHYSILEQAGYIEGVDESNSHVRS